jgi:hypothetical protein
MDTIIFEAFLSNSAHIFKNLIELLAHVAPLRKTNSIKQAFLKINANGICFYNDLNSNVSIYVMLDRKYFCSYKFEFDDFQDINVGISLDILKNFMKTIKKNEGICIRIFKKDIQIMPNEIEFAISSTNNNRSKRGFTIKFNIIQNRIILPQKYLEEMKLVELNNIEFLNICKEMGGTKKDISVISHNKELIFSCNQLDIGTNWLAFSQDNDTKDFNIKFPSEYVKTIVKMSTFSKKINIYIDENHKMLIFESDLEKNLLSKSKHPDKMGSIVVSIETNEIL